MIASSSLFNNITSFGVDTIDLSVHFPLYCTPSFTVLNQNITEQNDTLKQWVKYKWKPEFNDEYINKFNENFKIFNEQTEMNPSDNVVSLLSKFVEVFQKSAISMKSKSCKPNSDSQPLWWDNECEIGERNKLTAL